jgi:hypothetical protein
MTKEQILKLLAALGVKIGEGGIAEDDAVKLVTEQFDAVNRGLLNKRDELLGAETKLKQRIADYEAGKTEAEKKIAELETQVKKNNPEEYKAYYEGLAKELETKHSTAINDLTAERDKYRESHYSRIRKDSIDKALENIKFVEGFKNGFVALAMQNNTFTPTEIDGKTVFINQDNKTIEAVLHELSLSSEGKGYFPMGDKRFAWPPNASHWGNRYSPTGAAYIPGGQYGSAPRYGGPEPGLNAITRKGVIKYKKGVYPHTIAVHPAGQSRIAPQGCMLPKRNDSPGRF